MRGRGKEAESLGASQAALSVSVAAQSGLSSPWPQNQSPPTHRVPFVLTSTHTCTHTSILFATLVRTFHQINVNLLNPKLFSTL